jgi:hypothetical protein
LGSPCTCDLYRIRRLDVVAPRARREFPVPPHLGAANAKRQRPTRHWQDCQFVDAAQEARDKKGPARRPTPALLVEPLKPLVDALRSGPRPSAAPLAHGVARAAPRRKRSRPTASRAASPSPPRRRRDGRRATDRQRSCRMAPMRSRQRGARRARPRWRLLMRRLRRIY